MQTRFSVFKKLLVFVVIFSSSFLSAQEKTKEATWIWYPGDFEINLANQMQNRRTERDSFFPVFWKTDSPYNLVDFHKFFDLQAPEDVTIAVEGTYNIKIDGKALQGFPKKISMPAGKHKLSLKVYNQASVPAIFIDGKTIKSDNSWLVTYEDKEWIDETGKASDQSGTTWLQAGSWNLNQASLPPSKFALPVKKMEAVSHVKMGTETLYDFGKETFGFIQLNGLQGKGTVAIYYGESKEEALSKEHCETLDQIEVASNTPQDRIMELSKAFRYVLVAPSNGVEIASVMMWFEYADLKDKGSFTCSDAEINEIYDVAKYTFHLTSREFFIDGIKRDRWIWSGDAYQSYLMNYYLTNDSPTVERTLLALRGKDPVTAHINTIMDYTFYWFLGIYDYYQYSGDKTFIKQFYPRMQSLMEYCLSRRNENGMMQGLSGDWIFIDWAEGLSKKGEVSFEQLLLARSLEAMTVCAAIAGNEQDSAKYKDLGIQLKTKIFDKYWNPEKQALVHSYVDGKQTENVTRYANMFAIFFDYFNEEQKQQVKKSVLLNDKVQKIVTPYMRFYELESLCAMGEQDYVLKEMKEYWGGMLKLGATSFWEEYNPTKKGTEHLAMYGREFGKSLCHAWGASPIYLLGKYYLGVKPTAPGYSEYEIKPSLGGLQWMQGKVPTPNGEIEVYCSTKEIKVKAVEGEGKLIFESSAKPKSNSGTITALAKNKYQLIVKPNVEYKISYKAL
ncbi:alpha-rhamnosidase [Flavobacterium cupreum]|uniref:Alpha-rhamnosidase n=2 Tax=Flavobacterium TaxID=237 RepID=A0A434A1R7_9FLAO|nr:family 78 glycoside hydrolase catalytic domain [Flavobacterium cupreum]RUT68311.1 alpha-rhamnosidase [Flavobacterium cupreum]